MRRSILIGLLTMLMAVVSVNSVEAAPSNWSSPITLRPKVHGTPVQNLAIGVNGTIAASVLVGHDNGVRPISSDVDSVWVIPPSGDGRAVWTGSDHEGLLDLAFLGSTPFILTQAVNGFGGSNGSVCCSVARVREVVGERVDRVSTIDEDLTSLITGALVPVGRRLLSVVISHAGLATAWRGTAGRWANPQLIQTSNSGGTILSATAGDRVAFSPGAGFVYSATGDSPFQRFKVPNVGPGFNDLAISGSRTSILDLLPGSDPDNIDGFNNVGDLGPDGFTSTLEVPGTDAIDAPHAIAGDARGDEIFVWQACAAGCPLEAVFSRNGGPFSSPQILDQSPVSLHVGFTGDGIGIIAWTSGHSVFTSLLTPGALAFSPPETVTTHLASPDQAGVTLAVSSGNTAALSWLDSDKDIAISRFEP